MLNFKEIKKLIANGEKDKVKNLYYDYIEDSHKNINEQTYLSEKRHITNEVLIDYFKIGYDKESNYIVMPTNPLDYNIMLRRANTQAVDKYSKVKPPKIEDEDDYIFNKDILDKKVDIIFLTEGTIDSLSLYEELLKHKENIFKEGIIYNSTYEKYIGTIGLNGLGINQLENLLTDESTNDIFFFISFDNDPKNEKGEDQKGKQMARELKQRLDLKGINSYIPNWEAETVDGIPLKDLNDQLTKNESRFYNSILENIVVTPLIVDFNVDDFKNEYSSLNSFNNFRLIPPKKPIKTGYPLLDSSIGDGLYPNLYFLGASSSLGKSTFCLNLALNIIDNNEDTDIIYFTLEMDKELIFMKLISKLSNKLHTDKELEGLSIYDYRRTKRGLFSNVKNYDLAKTAEDYFKNNYANRFFIKERKSRVTVEDIENFISQYISIMKKKPVVFIDYIQIIDSTSKNQNDKQKADDIVNNLKSIKNNYGVPIIGISSFNRGNYNTEANMSSFKESGSIEYTCDYLIVLEPIGLIETTAGDKEDVKANKKINNKYLESPEAEVKLTLLKNREGQTRSKIVYDYNKKFNYFKELRFYTEGE